MIFEDPFIAFYSIDLTWEFPPATWRFIAPA